MSGAGHLPFQNGGGNYTIAIQYPLPGGINATTSEVSAVSVDIYRTAGGPPWTTVATGVALAYDATAETYEVVRPDTDFDGARFIRIVYTPTVVAATAADGIVAPSARIVSVSGLVEAITTEGASVSA